LSDYESGGSGLQGLSRVLCVVFVVCFVVLFVVLLQKASSSSSTAPCRRPLRRVAVRPRGAAAARAMAFQSDVILGHVDESETRKRRTQTHRTSQKATKTTTKGTKRTMQ